MAVFEIPLQSISRVWIECLASGERSLRGDGGRPCRSNGYLALYLLQNLPLQSDGGRKLLHGAGQPGLCLGLRVLQVGGPTPIGTTEARIPLAAQDHLGLGPVSALGLRRARQSVSVLDVGLVKGHQHDVAVLEGHQYRDKSTKHFSLTDDLLAYVQ